MNAEEIAEAIAAEFPAYMSRLDSGRALELMELAAQRGYNEGLRYAVGVVSA